MNDFKTIKAHAREHLKRHYILLVVVCAIAILVGTEFSLVVDNAQTWYDILTGQVTQLDAEGARINNREFTDRFLEDLVDGNEAAGQQEAAERMAALRDATSVHSALGRRRGALAALMNSVNSGQLYVTIGTALRSMLRSGEAAAIALILGSLLLHAALWIFFRNFYGAVLRRVCLESRAYRTFPMNHFFHFGMTNRYLRASMTMLLQAVFEVLWGLTIVGWCIKRYSYFLVPFIVAENRDIKPRQAVTLSRRMMNGHKFECFRLELSFLGWMVLGFVTFGIADALWTLPYRMAAYTEFYVHVREAAKARGIEGAELLNDDCLFTPADAETLREAYADVTAQEQALDAEPVPMTPRQRFFAKNFGIWLGRMADKQVYARRESLKQQLNVARLELNGEAYPQRLNALWTRKRAAYTGRVSYLTPCTVWSLAVVFFTFSVAGWLWEVSLHLITVGDFVNRGALHGPWLPIYGSGVVLISVLLYRFRTKPVMEAVAIILLSGVVEYTTSWALEAIRGMRWWDYTGYFLNLNGRICGEGLAMFAAGGMAAVYLLVPLIDTMVTRVRSARMLAAVCAALMVCFTGDFVYSQFVPNTGEGITDDPEVVSMTQAATPADDSGG